MKNQDRITTIITEDWEEEVLANIFGEEEIYTLKHDSETDEEYELEVIVKRVKK